MNRSRYLVLFWSGALAAVLGQGPAAAQAPKEAPPAKPGEEEPAADLSTRFQFQERYSVEDKPNPGAIGQYRVGILQTIKSREERPQGGPQQVDWTAQTIFNERPAEVDGNGQVLAAVRRYETYRLTPTPARRTSDPRSLEKLAIWFQTRPDGDPMILSLTPGRALRESEYSYANRHFFMPDLASALPPRPTRIGDPWSLSRAGAVALLGEAAGRGDPLMGQLKTVTRSSDGRILKASMTISGRAVVPDGETAINAELVFSFSPSRPPSDPEAPKEAEDEGTVSALGAITSLRMATVKTSAIGGANGRLRRRISREVILERQLPSPGPVLAIPSPPPVPSEANSWLTYEDPQGRFHFRHPQELAPGAQSSPDGNLVELVHHRPEGLDRVEVEFQPKTGDPEQDRNLRSPDFLTKDRDERWRQDKLNAAHGPAGWLKEPEWAASHMKVYRINAALKGGPSPARRDARLHDDVYLVLFGRDESLVIEATTPQDPPLPFRKQVETIIRTFRFGPLDAK